MWGLVPCSSEITSVSVMSLALVGHHVGYLILSCVSAPPTLLDVVFFCL